MSNLTKRILTALVALPVALYAVYIGGFVYTGLIVLLTIAAAIELNQATGQGRRSLHPFVVIVVSLLIPLSAHLGFTVFFTTFTVICITGTLYELVAKKIEGSTSAYSLIFLCVYPGLLFSHSILLRNLHAGEIASAPMPALADQGLFFLVTALICAVANDVFAFIIGKLFGKRKIAPVLSPGKTVEGTLAGLLAGIVMVFVVNSLFGSPLSADWVVLWSLIVGTVSFLGDLFESSIKRGAGLKDSGTLFPGHGGVLDRIDGLIFTLPASYYFILLYLVLQGHGLEELVTG